MTDIFMIGRITEELAIPILKDEFKFVEWISDVKPNSPFDFICKDEYNKKYRIDVKSCQNKIIYISEKKFEKLKEGYGDYKNFYYLLLADQRFHLISFKDLLNDKNYTIIHKGTYKNFNRNMIVFNMYLSKINFMKYFNNKETIDELIKKTMKKELQGLIINANNTKKN